MSWNASLQLDYRYEAPRTLLRFAHDGPLRVLQSLYPEGNGICHNVLVHPPGGLVEGDTLAIDVSVAPGAHALVSTQGATRFYKSSGQAATQTVTLRLAANARLEWLPLETIAYPGCQAVNQLLLDLAPGAELLAWDVTALGLPGAQQPFDAGHLSQRLHWPGVWREQSHLAATDTTLLDSPLGLAGHRCMGTLVLASGTPMGSARREQLLETVRAAVAPHALAATTGATCPNDQVLVVRTLSPLVEPTMDLFKHLWAQLRPVVWGLGNQPPRIWGV
ncbi:MAG: urease accessory protein UreD [Burkholderiaceae bacterium]